MAFSVEYHTIDNPGDNFIDLDGTAVSVANVALDPIGGTAQALPGDFGVSVDGTRVLWDSPSYGLYNQITSDSTVRVIYDRS